MALDPLEELDLSELPDYDADAEYGALLRALRRQQGFGILFVRCSPSQGKQLIADLKGDLPQKRCAELTLTEPLADGDFFGYASKFVAEHPAEVVFVQGMEHSLLDYEETKRQSGWTKAEIQNYSWKDVPPILRNLNQQRDRFRNELPVCFVFLVPLFLVKYLTRRAPDFFDWRSGVFEVQGDDATLEQQVGDCRLEDPSQIKELSEGERIQRALEIKDLLDNPTIQDDQRFRLLYDLGLIQFENQDSHSGWVSWDKASHVSVSEAESCFLQGNVLYDFRRYEEAIASYERALDIKADNYATWYNLGNALAHLGRDEEAIISYEKAVAIKAGLHAAWYNRGRAFDNLRRYEEAIISYERALEIKADFHEAWYNRGNALIDLGCYEEAIASYERAVDIKPDKDEAWCNRGIALDDLGRYEEAIASYERAVAIKPDDHGVWYNQGSALIDLGRYEEAIASYERAVEVKPDLHAAWKNRGRAFANLGRYEEAIASYERAVAIKPDDHEAWNNRGNALYNLGRYEEAIASYDRAVEIKPDKYEAWYSRGVALGRLRRLQESGTSLSKAFELNPERTIDLYFDGLIKRFPWLMGFLLFIKKPISRLLLPGSR